MPPTSNEPNFGTYRRDGETRVAQSIDQAVQYEFTGWSKVADAVGDAVGTTTPVVGRKATKSTTATSTAKPAAAKTITTPTKADATS